MKGFILGVIVTVAVILGAIYIYFSTGMVPVATADPMIPFEKKLARMALNARIDKEMPKTVPIPADEANLLAGAHVYTEHCAVCHGLPDQPETAITKGLFPKTTLMFVKKGVTDDPPGESYWKVANGIRLSGMPGFKQSLSETELWQAALLVANADKLSPAVKAVLAQPPAAIPPPSPGR